MPSFAEPVLNDGRSRMFARVVFIFRSYVGGTLHATAEDSCGIDSPKFLAAICPVIC